METIVTAAVIALIASTIYSKAAFNVIDGYVKDMIEHVKDMVELAEKSIRDKK